MALTGAQRKQIFDAKARARRKAAKARQAESVAAFMRGEPLPASERERLGPTIKVGQFRRLPSR